MPDELKIDGKVVRLTVGFITNLEGVDAIVYYARPDLTLGAGFGTAIATQGGPKVQEELKQVGGSAVTEVVVTGGGNLSARHILHAVGPRFQEEDGDAKLRATMVNTLRKAEELKLRKIAFPAMGSGFYGIPLDQCAQVTLLAAKDFLKSAAELTEILFCLRDLREFKVFQQELKTLA